MKPEQLILRCYARPAKNGVWSAVCIDLSLAAQGDSFEEAKAKLDAQIREYIFDVIEGDDHQHASVLLSRKAPLRQIATYHWLKLRINFFHLSNGLPRLFDETLPVRLAC